MSYLSKKVAPHHLLVPSDATRRWVSICAILIGFSVALRLLAMMILPLTDTTEARYAEIARKMLESGNWVTLMHDYGVPFWAKPPLSTWLSALSMAFFGVNEFAVRLPNFILMFFVVALSCWWCLEKLGRQRTWFVALMMSSMILIYALSGTVMTDIALLASTHCVMIAFWQGRSSSPRLWGYLMFAAVGVGLLAKGPIAALLPGFAIFIWTIWQREFVASCKRLPWFGGILLMLAIAVPWYWLAEQRTPGFLQYFLVGEHLNRFLVAGWQGDLYGHAHKEPVGTIILYWLEGALPWWPLALVAFASNMRLVRQRLSALPSWHRYLVVWMLLPLVFFPARNIIPTYPLIGLPAFALLVSSLWPPIPVGSKGWYGIFALSLLSAALCGALILMTLFMSASDLPKMSQKRVVDYFQHHQADDADMYYFKRRYYSAEFYSRGRSHVIDKWSEVEELIEDGRMQFVAVHSDHLSYMPAGIRSRLVEKTRVGSIVVFKVTSKNIDDSKLGGLNES